LCKLTPFTTRLSKEFGLARSGLAPTGSQRRANTPETISTPLGPPVSPRQLAGPTAEGDWATENRLRIHRCREHLWIYRCREHLWIRTRFWVAHPPDHNFGLNILVGGVGDRKPGPDPQVPTAPVDPQVQTPLVNLQTITEDVGRGKGDVRSTHGLVSCSPQPF
jgi:hypothetical protein